MSMLLRALMGQQTQEEPGGNLATVTDGEVVFDGMGSSITTDTPIRATLRNGTQYSVSFDLSVTLTNKGSDIRARITQYGTWHSPSILDFREAKIGEVLNKHYEKAMTAYRDRIPPQDSDIFNIGVKDMAGTARIYNVVITEV